MRAVQPSAGIMTELLQELSRRGNLQVSAVSRSDGEKRGSPPPPGVTGRTRFSASDRPALLLLPSTFARVV